MYYRTSYISCRSLLGARECFNMRSVVIQYNLFWSLHSDYCSEFSKIIVPFYEKRYSFSLHTYVMFERNADTTPLRLGRMNAHLPAEILILRFLGIVSMPSSSNFKTTLTPACEWYGVRCNDAQNVERIDWHDMNSACETYSRIIRGGNLRGTLRWEHLPVTVLALELYSNDLMGEVRLDALPRDLQRLKDSVL